MSLPGIPMKLKRTFQHTAFLGDSQDKAKAVYHSKDANIYGNKGNYQSVINRYLTIPFVLLQVVDAFVHATMTT